MLRMREEADERMAEAYAAHAESLEAAQTAHAASGTAISVDPRPSITITPHHP